MGSPNYLQMVTAQLKALLDRMADAVHCQLLTGKYCCSVASGGSNYDQVTVYLDDVMLNFGAFVTGNAGVVMSGGPAAIEAAEKKAYALGQSLAGDISSRRDYIEQRRLHEKNRRSFQQLVKMNKENWEHEYEYWSSINWK